MGMVLCVLIFMAGIAVGGGVVSVIAYKKPSGVIQVWNDEGKPALFLSLDISMNELSDSDGKDLSFKVDWSHFE